MSTTEPTTTPRTDLASFRPTGAAEVVFADFARQLERELTAAHATIEGLRRERIAADNERLRLEGLNRVANTERNDAVKRLADLRAQLEGLTKERDALRRERATPRVNLLAFPAKDTTQAEEPIVTVVEAEDARLIEAELNDSRAAMSSLSLWLSQGMGDRSTTAEQYEQRIRDGVNHMISVEVERREKAQAELASLQRRRTFPL